MASPASPTRKRPSAALGSAAAAIASPSRQMAKGGGGGGGGSGSNGGGSGSGRKVSSREGQPLVRVQKQVREARRFGSERVRGVGARLFE